MLRALRTPRTADWGAFTECGTTTAMLVSTNSIFKREWQRRRLQGSVSRETAIKLGWGELLRSPAVDRAQTRDLRSTGPRKKPLKLNS